MKPGDDLLVGFKFTLNPGWHTYWENPGDAGEGASIKWNLPNDVDASNILWPGPERIPVEPLMTFGYEDEVVLLTKIYTSETTIIPVTLNAQVSWYTCKEICIPQEAEVSIPIDLGNKTSSASKGLLEHVLDQRLCSLMVLIEFKSLMILTSSKVNLKRWLSMTLCISFLKITV